MDPEPGLGLMLLGSVRVRGVWLRVHPLLFLSIIVIAIIVITITADATALIRNRRYTTVSWITSKNEGELHTTPTHNRRVIKYSSRVTRCISHVSFSSSPVL